MSLKNIEKYSQERQRRWQMAREGEPRAVQSACTALEQILGTPCAYTRYDGLWFEAFDPQEPGNGWVRGAPDYLIRFNRRYIYAEIKLKSVMFHMTLTGGQMGDGTVIPCYGCESLYLDKEPVYKNMRAFARAVGVAPESFLLLFACPDGIRAISLAEIDALVEKGFRGVALGLISDGYGTAVEGGQAASYLLPVDATHLLAAENGSYFTRHTAPAPVKLPQVYCCNPWYYHWDRQCKYIATKDDGDLTVFSGENDALLSGRRPCENCCL